MSSICQCTFIYCYTNPGIVILFNCANFMCEKWTYRLISQFKSGGFLISMLPEAFCCWICGGTDLYWMPGIWLMWAWILNSEAEKQTLYGLLYLISIINPGRLSEMIPLETCSLWSPRNFQNLETSIKVKILSLTLRYNAASKVYRWENEIPRACFDQGHRTS